MGESFAKRELDSPRLLAEMLLSHVIGCDRLKLYTDPDRPATPLERDTLRTLVQRALQHEPVQYLVGEAWFFGLQFKVDKRVLIPRPATEVIVENLLQHARASHPGKSGGEGLMIADVCTGSGCIAIALLKRLPGARAVATDISPEALAVAHDNAVRHGVVDRLDLLQGDLLEPLAEFPATRGDESLDYLVSNPPYIPDDEWPHKVDRNVLDHEPHAALRGGPDGMRFVSKLLADGPRFVKRDGLALIEVADSKAPIARAAAEQNALLAEVSVLKDHEGLMRTILSRRRS